MKEETQTTKITNKAISLLDQSPGGLRTSQLLKLIAEGENFHPKTINGIVWKLAEKHPEKIYKPERGLFKLTKYKG